MAGQTLDILVCDDESALREALRQSFAREGHRVLAVADGRSAIDRASTQRFDVLLLDVALGPDSPDGYEVCRELRDRHNDVPIIMLTAMDSEADAVLGLEAGADDYVVKPFRPAELRSRIRAVLRRTAPHALMARRDRVHGRHDLLRAIWGESAYRDPRAIDVHVRHLREKLEDVPEDPRLILTVRGAGYRISEP